MSKAIANQMFLAYMGRPADSAWQQSTANVLNGNQPSAALQTAFYNAAVSEGVFLANDSMSTLVNKVFLQTFGFAASTFEQNAWANSGVSREAMAWTIFTSYLGATNVPAAYQLPTQSKLMSVAAYTDQLQNDGAANLALSQGGLAATNARTQISGVTSQATAATFITGVVANVSSSGVSIGQTFTLTTGVDIPAATSGNDVFNGTNTTLNSFDNINGGAGDDTLNLAWTGATAAFAVPASTTFAGLENVNVSNAGTNAGTNAVTVTNTTFGTGVKKLNWTEAGAGATDAVSVTLASATDVSIVSTGVTFTTVAVTDTSTTVASTGSTLKNITLTKVNGAQTLTGNAINTLNLNTQATAVATITAAAGTRDLTVNTAGIGSIIGVTDAQATSLTLNNTGAQSLGTYTVAKAATVNVSTTAAATGLVVTAATAKTLNISGTNTVAAVITGSTALTDINISGAGAGLTSVVDLSGIATGLANITSTATTTGSGTTKVGAVTLGATTVTQGFGTNVTFTGGAGDDIITVGATTKTIDVGAGANKVFLVAGTTALGTGGKITATTGSTDTLVLAQADAVSLTTNASTTGAAFKTAVTGFETLDIGTAVDATNVSLTAFGSFNELVVTPATVTQTISGLTTGKTITLNTTAAAFTSLTANNLSGAADTLTVNLKGDLSAALVAYGTLTTPGVETLTINTVSSSATHTATLSTVTVVDAAAQSIVITGNNGVALTFAGLALSNFDASGLTKGAVTYTSGILTTDVTVKGSASGGDTLDFSAATSKVTITATAGTNTLLGGTLSANITGGSGNDTITGGAAADVLIGGPGNDRILAGTGADTMTGGTGVDTFVMSGGVANLYTNSLATTAGMDRITDFTSGTDKIAVVNAGTPVTSVVLTNVTVATAADVATLLTAIGNQVALSAGAAQQVGVITVSAGAMAGTYLLFNDTANAASALDTLVNITGTPTVTAADFVFA